MWMLFSVTIVTNMFFSIIKNPIYQNFLTRKRKRNLLKKSLNGCFWKPIRSWSGPNRFHIYVHIQTAFHPAIHTKQNPIFFISSLKSLDILYDTSYLYQRASCLNYKSSLIAGGLRSSFRGQIWFWFCKMYLLREKKGERVLQLDSTSEKALEMILQKTRKMHLWGQDISQIIFCTVYHTFMVRIC